MPIVRPLLVLALLLLCGCTTLRTARKPSGPALKVMTYNVNFGLGGDPATLAAVSQGEADLICLQETTPAWEEALRRELSGRYPYMAFKHHQAAGGLAVLSRFPFKDMETRASPVGWFPAWRVMVSSPLGALQVVLVHLHPPVSESGSVISGYFTTPSVRKKEMADFATLIAPELPTLVLGDFNEDEGGRAVALLERRGFRSVLGEFQRDTDTWRWHTSLGQIRHSLDHILYDPRLEPLDARVVNAGRSDHLPVLAIFQKRRTTR